MAFQKGHFIAQYAPSSLASFGIHRADRRAGRRAWRSPLCGRAGHVSLGLVLAPFLVLAGLVPSRADSAWPTTSTCSHEGAAMSRVELYFGLAREGRRPVSNKDWAHFVDTQIGPRFPDGFTVLTGQGRWRTERGAIVKETSHVLIVWYHPGPSVEAKIEALRDVYRRQFSQKSVMRADGSGCVSFK